MKKNHIESNDAVAKNDAVKQIMRCNIFWTTKFLKSFINLQERFCWSSGILLILFQLFVFTSNSNSFKLILV